MKKELCVIFGGKSPELLKAIQDEVFKEFLEMMSYVKKGNLKSESFTELKNVYYVYSKD